MKGKSILLSALVVVVFLVGLFILKHSETAKIHKLLNHVEASLRQKDLEGLMKAVSLKYKDPYGLTYLSLKKLFQRYFHSYRIFDIHIDEIKIKITKDTAKAKVYAIVIGLTESNQEEYLLGTEKLPEPLILYLQKEFLNWKVTGAYLPMREGLV